MAQECVSKQEAVSTERLGNRRREEGIKDAFGIPALARQSQLPRGSQSEGGSQVYGWPQQAHKEQFLCLGINRSTAKVLRAMSRRVLNIFPHEAKIASYPGGLCSLRPWQSHLDAALSIQVYSQHVPCWGQQLGTDAFQGPASLS